MTKQLDLFNAFKQPDYLIYSEVFPDAESDEIEYKSAFQGFPKDFWKTYSAFANSGGGVIVLGVKEKNNKFHFDGLSDGLIEKYKKEFWNNVNNPSTISVNLLYKNDVREYSLDSSKVLAFHIPVAERKHKPVYLTSNPFKNTYKRNHEGDYVCRDEEVRRMMADADLSFSPDSRILEGYTIEDIDASSLKQYRQLFASVRPSHPWLTLDDIEFLEKLGGYRKDRKSGKAGFTVAGIIMFGKYLSIIDQECCPKFFPDYRELLSNNEDIRWSDRIYPDGTWESNLFQFYKLVYPKLTSRLPRPFQLVKGQRLDETPAHTSLREAFVNALIHTDYSAPGSIIIESRPDSFRFTNPGTLLVTMPQFYKGGISQCRNIHIQNMFLLIGSAEKAGSGVSKIISGWLSSHWRRPYLNIETEPDRVVLEMPLFSVIPDDTLEELKKLFGESVEALGKEELTALSICQIEGDITNLKLQYHFDLHRTDITKLLQDLCKSGYLISENKSRWTTYRLNTEFKVDIINEDTSNEDTSIKDTPNTDTSNEESSNEDTSNEDTSNEDTSNEDTSEIKDQSTRTKDLKRKIIEVCSNNYISIEEIANRVGRSVRHLKNKVIPEMIKNNFLVKLYPQKNHPQQKYISKNK
jgi:ATP-dependent DNA helicase RecG